MTTAVAAFSGLDATLKLFSQHYPPMQVAVLRGLASLPFMLLPVLALGRLADLKPRRFGMHLLRGALSVAVLGGFIYAVRVLSLANAYSIFLAAPLIVTALSVPLLGDRVDWRTWLAISIGLIGVLTMLRPSASALVTLGALAALLSATAYSFSAIALRVLTRTDTTASVVFWTLGLMTVFAGVIAAPQWVPLQRAHLKWLVAMGVFGSIGQLLFTEAFRSAPPSIVAPFEYTALLWGVAIDWAMWDVLPAGRIYLGGSIVIASGLYLIWRERLGSTAVAASGAAAP
ncbi:MAG: DMT family transporter [Gammaproteobacteria bacterium]|nr:MAG: DMT family transporter [Gammaproteobacteria bacterium]